MSKTLVNAEKLYNSFVNKQSEKDFFIGFADYFSYLEKNPELLACFIPEIEKGNELGSVLKNAETLAITEFKEIFEKVKEDTKKNKLDTRPYIMELYKDIDDHFTKKVASSAPLLNNVYNDLVDIVSVLVKEKKLDDVRKYAKLYEQWDPVVLHKIVAPKLQEWTEMESYKKQQEQLSVWGLFFRVRNLHNMFSQCEVEFKRLAKKENATSEDRLTWIMLASSVNEYMNLIHANGKSIQNHYFIKHKHIGDIERFHNFLTINYVEVEPEKLEDKTNKDIVYFDEIINKLCYNEKKIGFSRGSNVSHTIRYIFSRNEPYEECFYDEIADTLDKSKNTSDKNIYDSLLQFSERLTKEEIGDLLIVNYHSVLINPKYKVKNLHDKTR